MLVPGERRRRAVGHFRQAGFEVLRGLRELASLQGRPAGQETGRRGHIEIQ